MRARTKHLERRFRRRVAPADDHDALAIVGVRLVVVMVHVRKILTRHANHDGMVVVADGHDDVAGVTNASDPTRRSRLDHKHVILPA